MNQPGKTLVEIMDMDFPPIREIWGPIITDASITLLYAPAKAGKTLFVDKLGHSIATGSKLLKFGCSKTDVVKFDFEMVMRTIAIRARKMDQSAAIQIRGSEMRIVTEEDMGGTLWNMSESSQQAMFERAIGTTPVVIFDNYQTGTSPLYDRDTEFAMWARTATWLKRLRTMGKAVILVDHANKAGQADGTVRKQNLVNTVIALRPREKTKNGMMFDLVFERTRDVWGDDADPMIVELIETPEGTQTWIYHDLETEQIRRMSKMLNQKPPIPMTAIASEMNLSYFEACELAEKCKGEKRDGTVREKLNGRHDLNRMEEVQIDYRLRGEDDVF